MRYILLIGIIFLFVSSAKGQIQAKQVKGGASVDSLYVMLTDTVDGSGTKGLGKWFTARDFQALTGDRDWLKLTTNTIPTNTDSAYRAGYTLFKGLDGGLNQKIEFLKEGILQFDQESGQTEKYIMRIKPLQNESRNVDFIISQSTSHFSGSRDDNVVYMGWNAGPGGTADEPGKGALFLALEDFYNPAGTAAHGEFHLTHIDTLGVVRKPITSFTNVGTTSTWSLGLSYPQVKFTDPDDANKPYFQFLNSNSGTQAAMRMLNPVTSKGMELICDPDNNNVQWTNLSMSNPTLYSTQFTWVEQPKTRIIGDEGTPVEIVGRNADGWVAELGTGWGLDITGGTLLVDSSQVATQYDLTTISGGGDTDWYAEGTTSAPDNDDNMFHDGRASLGYDIYNAKLNIWNPDAADQGGIFLSGYDDGYYLLRSCFGGTTDYGWDLAHSDVGNLMFYSRNDPTITYPVQLSLGAPDNSFYLLPSGQINLSQYDATPPTGTPFRLIAHESDGDLISPTWAQVADSIEVAGVMTSWSFATGDTGGSEAITNGETVTLSAGTGMDFTRTTNTGFVSLDLDEITTDAVPEGDEYVVGSDGSTVNEKWAITNFDLSTTNEAWTADADDADTEVITNQTVKMEGGVGIVTDYVPASDKFTFAVDGSEFSTITTIETTDYFLIHDANGAGTGDDALEKITYANLITDIIADVGSSADGNGIYDGSGTVPTSTIATLTDNITFNAGASEADLFIDGTNDLVGIGTNSPEEQLTISNEDSNLSYPIMAYHTDQTGSGSSVLGQTKYYYGSEDLVKVKAAKTTSAGTNDAELTFTMEDASNAEIDGLQLDYEENYVIDKPRTRIFGGVQMARVDSLDASTTLDESYYSVRATTSGITITLMNANTTNGEFIGMQYIIFNDSGGNITINPGGTNDYINGSSADITLADKAGYFLTLMFTTGFNTNHWVGFKTP